MKAVICAIAKYEYNYIKEWVDYHINLGFDKIVIYDNNNDEKYDDLLSSFIKKGQVEIRDVRGKLAMQRVVYNEFYKEGDFDWVAFIDIDEFISPNRTKYKNIKEFIEKNSACDAIWLYWQTFGDSGKIYPSTKYQSVLKEYNVPAPEDSLIDNALKIQNAWGKSIIKKGLPVNYLHEHFIVDPHNINYVDCFGKSVSPMLYYPNNKYVKSTYKECFIKHIYTKSLSEYVDCKIKRPAANSFNDMHYASKYFKVNDITEEKRKYLESIGYKMEFIFEPDAFVIIEIKNIEEYNKLKPYILNIMDTCCCRFNLYVTEDKDAVQTIYNEIGGRFNECNITYCPKNEVISQIFNVYYSDVSSVIKHTNCIMHLNIPYNVDINDYIETFVEPVFGNNLKQNLKRLFYSDKAIYVAKPAISKIDKKSEIFAKFKELMKNSKIETNIDYAIFTGNFIAKTKDIVNTKNTKIFNNIHNQLNTDNIMYFISSMFDNFIYNYNL